MRSRLAQIYILSFLLLLATAQASATPTLIPFQGRLTDSSGNTVNYAVTVNFRIYPPAGACYIYEDTQSVTPNDYGVFSVLLGSSGNSTGPANTISNVFNNNPTAALSDSCATTYSPASNDWRRIEVVVDGYTLTDQQTIGTAPFALQAANLQGKAASDFIQVSGNVTQGNMGTLVNAGDASALHHHNSLYTAAGTLNGSALPSFAAGQSLLWNGSAWTAFTAITSESDPTVTAFAKASLPTCGAGEVLKGDGTSLSCVTDGGWTAVDASTTVKGYVVVPAAGGLSISSGSLSLPDVASAGTYQKVTIDAKGRVTTGTTLSQTDIPQLTSSGNGVDGGAITAGTIGGSTAMNTTGNVTANAVSASTVSTRDNRIYETTNTNYVSIQAPASLGANYTLTLPTSLGTANQMVGMNSGATALENKTFTAGSGVTITHGAGTITFSATGSGGTVTSVTGNSPISISGTANDPVVGLSTSGVTAATYGSATQVPAFTVNANGLITSASNTTISGVSPVGASLTSANVWIGSAGNVAAAVSISGDATLSNAGALTLAGSGVTANTYGSATQVPVIAVDSKGRVTSASNTTITGVSPVGSSLSSANFWIGSAGNVATGVTMSGDASLSSTGALTIANSAITNTKVSDVSVSKITSAASAYFTYQPNGASCSNAQVLTWNNGATRWECGTASTGSVTSVATGNGLTGGTITTAGTISVDTGTTANQIVQLDGSARLPGVDGSALSNISAAKIQSYPVSSSSPTDGYVLTWNNSTSVWEPRADGGGSVTSVSTGTGLTGGTITSAGTISVDVGTTASKIVQLDGSARLPGVDGSALSNVNATKLRGYGVSTAAPTNGYYLVWNNSTTVWEPQVGTGITALAGDVTGTGPGTATVTIGNDKVTSAKINNTGIAVSRLLITDATTGASVTYATCGTNGQVLNWTASGWACTTPTSGTITSVATGTGLTGGTITSVGTIAVDVGTIANKIVQLDGSARLPAVDGSQLTNLNAAGTFLNGGNSFGGVATIGTNDANDLKLEANNTVGITLQNGGNVGIGTTTPAAKFEVNGTMRVPTICDENGANCKTISSGWGAGGSVTNVYTGTGLTGGPITTSGTISVDVGTIASKIVQLNGSAQLPAVDGSNLTLVNAVKLQSNNMASTAPTDNYVLTWNNGASQWEPRADGGGTVQNVVGGTGLTGGTITSGGTLAVDVGTIASKIVQLDGSARLPGVDGSALSNVNAEKLQGYRVAVTAPTDGYVLTWNNGASLWEPRSATSGTVTNVATGTGLSGGPISSAGTISVDVGTIANKIVQLNGSAQLPAVDGSNLTLVNAVKLQTYNVASTAPADTYVLTWNNGASQWEPRATAAAGVVSVAGGTGLTGGTITSGGTLAVDVGTTASKIVQLDGSARLPGIDGSALSNVNAEKLQGYRVAVTAPTDGYVLTWNNGASLWEPRVGTGITALSGDITGGGTGTVATAIGSDKVTSTMLNSTGIAVSRLLITDATTGASVTYATCGTNGQVLNWTASGWACTTPSSGTMLSLTAGTGLTGGTITTAGTISVDVGTIASKIVQLNGSAQLPAVDGSNLTLINAVKLQTYNVASTAPTDTYVLTWNNGASQWEPRADGGGTVQNVVGGTGLTGGTITSGGTLAVDVGTIASKIVQLDGSARLPAVDGSQLTNLNAAGTFLNGGNSFGGVATIGTNDANDLKLEANNTVGITLQNGGNVGIGTTTPAAKFEVNGTMRVPTICDENGANCKTISSGWGAGGSVTNVYTGTGLTGGPITTSGTISVDVGTIANKIVQLNGSAQLPAVDGSNLTLVNAVKLQTYNVASTAPTDTYVLTWNNGASQWEPRADGGGTVQNVVGGTGLTGGTITSGGTLAVDVGTIASKIVQLNGSAQLPAVDGSNLTLVNAVKLQTRNVASTAPTDSYVLTWNNGASQWEPRAAAATGVTSITGGTGLTGGTITTAGTIAVDVGTIASKIVQLNGSAQLPAVDGSNLTLVNAVKLQSNNVASTAPTDNYVLTWNNGASQWEPRADGGGTVQNVVGGTGLTGGTITSGGTLAVDVGTIASKIVQLNGSAQLPAVDGSNLTLVNAVKLQTYSVASTAPTDTYVLTWNNGASQWEPRAAAATGVTSITGGTGLTGGTITSGGTLAVDVGTIASKIVQLNGSAQLPAVDGSNLTLVNAVKLQTRNVASTAPTDGYVLTWNNGASLWEPRVGTGITALSGDVTGGGTGTVATAIGSDKVTSTMLNSTGIAVSRLLITDATTGASVTYMTCGTNGQVLNWTASGWACTTPSSGTMLSLTAGTGLTGGTITTAGTIAVDVGTIANKIVQLNGSAQLPTVDGSNLTLVNAVKLQTYNVASTAPTDTYVLTWNNGASQWEPRADGGGTVQNVVGGTGLTGGTITSGGTLAVDVGTIANKIVQLNGSAQLPAVDGSNLTQINAVKLQSNNVASTAPTDSYVLTWNNGASQWEPRAIAGSAVTNTAAGNIAATDVQSAINELDSEKVAKAGDTMTGDLTVSANVTAVAFLYSSDQRLKQNIGPAPGLDLVTRLDGVRFNWIKDGREDIGLIAQEVEQVAPELVITDPKTGLKAVKYGNIVAPLIQSTKELLAKIQALLYENHQLKEEQKRFNQDVQRQLDELREENRQMKELLRKALEKQKQSDKQASNN